MVANLTLIGFMGAGKSVVGPLLAERLGMDFVDLDKSVERRTGMSIEEIFAREGEGGFRERESEALREELEPGGRVIACGGGVVLRDENVRLLRRKSRVFWLRLSPEEAVRRLRGAQGRPLLPRGGEEEAVTSLMQEREEKYRLTAHEVVDAGSALPEEIAEEIAERWSGYGCGHQEESTPSM